MVVLTPKGKKKNSPIVTYMLVFYDVKRVEELSHLNFLVSSL